MNGIFEDAYALQIDYDPQNPDIEAIKLAIEQLKIKTNIRNRGEWESEIRDHRKSHRTVVCHEQITIITRKDIDLMSEAQLVYLPINLKTGIQYYPLDAVTDVDALLFLKKNPFTNEILTSEEILFLETAQKNHKYPRIAVGDFFEEVDERLLQKSQIYIEKEYVKKMRELTTIIENTSLHQEAIQVVNFATEYILTQYNLFLKHQPLNQKLSEGSRDDASATTLNHILNYLQIQYQHSSDHGKLATMHIAYAIDEFIYLSRNSLTYTDLLKERGIANELYWKPNFLTEEYYNDGTLKCQYYTDEQGNRDISYKAWYRNGVLGYHSLYQHGIESDVTQYYGNGQRLMEANVYYYPNGNRMAIFDKNQYEILDEDGDSLGIGLVIQTLTIEKDQIDDQQIRLYLRVDDINLIGSLIKYHGNKRIGIWRAWYSNGNLRNHLLYNRNGNKVGFHTNWYENGQIKREIFFYDDQQIGLYQSWFTNGRLFVQTNYINNLKHGTHYEWYPNGVLKCKGDYVHGKRHGLWLTWYDTGNLKIEGEYENTKKIGFHSVFHHNGMLSNEFFYYDDQLIGLCRSWYDNGQLKIEGEYVHGKQHGLWKTWYDNGQLKIEGEYENTKKIGFHSVFHHNGMLSNEFFYYDDQLIGLCRSWDESGQLKSECCLTN